MPSCLQSVSSSFVDNALFISIPLLPSSPLPFPLQTPRKLNRNTSCHRGHRWNAYTTGCGVSLDWAAGRRAVGRSWSGLAEGWRGGSPVGLLVDGCGRRRRRDGREIREKRRRKEVWDNLRDGGEGEEADKGKILGESSCHCQGLCDWERSDEWV